MKKVIINNELNEMIKLASRCDIREKDRIFLIMNRFKVNKAISAWLVTGILNKNWENIYI